MVTRDKLFNYGMGAEKFSREAKLFTETGDYDITKATKFRDGFFRTYPGIAMALERMKTRWYDGHKDISTICGWTRKFYRHEKVSPGTMLNARIQGSSANLLKACIFIINKYVLPKFPGTRLVLQVHDELVVETPTRFAKQVGLLVKYVMEYPWFTVNVPLLASAKICKTWWQNSDEATPDIGYTYAEIAGVPRVFNESNWTEWVEVQEKHPKDIKNKSAAAALSKEQIAYCKTIIPDNGPLFKTRSGKRIVSREEELKARQSL